MQLERQPQSQISYNVFVSGSFLGEQVLSFECHPQWTFNQLKCFLMEYLPSVKFHHFMVSIMGRVPPHQARLCEMLDPYIKAGKKIQLYLTTRVSEDAQLFDSYYVERMNKFYKKVNEELAAMEFTAEQKITHMPILDIKYHRLKDCAENGVFVPAEKRKQLERDNLPRAENRQENRGVFHLGLLSKVMILTSIAITLSSQATFWQVFVIVLLLILHHSVGYFRQRNVYNAGEAGNRENQNGPIKKGLRKFRYYMIMGGEFAYVYVMSLFPNWNLDDDYLHRFRDRIARYQAEMEETRQKGEAPNNSSSNSEEKEESLVQPSMGQQPTGLMQPHQHSEPVQHLKVG